jgi:pilus assembly protein Flp/PilA
MAAILYEFVLSEEGATAIEYGLIAALVAIGIMASLSHFAEENSNLYNYVEGAVTNVVSGT